MMPRKLGMAILIVALALTAACDFPRDAQGTLERVRNGTMRVGFSDGHGPWVRAAGDVPAGIEPALIRQWAKQLGARLSWVQGSEAVLVDALQQGAIDVLIAGLDSETPFASRVALTQPYLTARIHIAAPSGAALPDEFTGRPVLVAHDRLAVNVAVHRSGAVPVPATDLQRGDLVWAGYDIEIGAQGMQPVGPALATERRVIATAPGESAFLLALDRFLGQIEEATILQLAAEERAR